MIRTRELFMLSVQRRVVIRQWEDKAMQLHRHMVSGVLRCHGQNFLIQHPTAHYGLVHPADIMKAQIKGYPGTPGHPIEATEGRLVPQHPIVPHKTTQARWLSKWYVGELLLVSYW